MTSPGSAKRHPFKFFILLFALSVPFWLAGGMAEQELPLPFSLPAGALVLVCPMVAALILIYREEGSNGIKQQIDDLVFAHTSFDAPPNDAGVCSDEAD